jgi:eukaryotic-like serine/threonine-protein kinase
MSEKGFLEQLDKKESKPESFQPEHFERVKKSNFKYYFLGLLLIVVVFGAFYIYNQPVIMINMTGMNENDATLWANKNDVQLIYTDVYSEDEALGKVVSQSIPESTKLNKSDVVKLTVSMGIDPDKVIPLPVFDSLWTKTAIISWIEENHVSNYQFVSIEDEAANDSTLLDFFTESDSTDSIKRSDLIVFNIAAQPEKVMITVIDLLNMSQTQAVSWASANELETVVKTAYSSTVDKGKVISQDALVGSSIEGGSTVTLIISKGPAIKIIDFQTTSMAEAKQWAVQNNIQLNTDSKYHMTIPSNKLISQSLAIGSWVATGTKIQLVYSLGNKLSIADYVDQPISQLESFVSSQNEQGAKLKLSITYQYSNVTSVNRVVYIEHRDTNISIDSKIEVIVSLGRLIKMPDLRIIESVNAESLALEVIQTCENSGLTCKISYVTTEDSEKANTVVYQSVEPNEYISNSILVEVKIAKLAD